MLLPKDIPLGKLVLFNVQEVIAPEPVIVGTSGKSLETVFLVRVTFSGEYEMVGSSSTTVMLRYPTLEPPLLLAQTL